VQESAVMGLLARGMRYKEIADELRISYAKVHKLQHKSYIKLQATNVAEAVTKWARLERGP
jgi:DNA-binding CsgD family transcriptional regulator